MPRLMMDHRITMPLLSLPNHDAKLLFRYDACPSKEWRAPVDDTLLRKGHIGVCPSLMRDQWIFSVTRNTLGRDRSNLVHNVYQFRMASPWLLYPTHCTTSISCLALYAFCVFRCVHCIRGFHCLDLDFVNTAYATEATEIHTIVSISSFGVTFR